MVDFKALREFVAKQSIAPRFVTISGAHLYGFPSPDSDIDLRGCHQVPLRDIVGLIHPDETVEPKGFVHGTEVEMVSHEIGKYFTLMLKNNGYVMEQIFSPLVVQGQEFLDVLRPLAQRCLTKYHYFHYRGFFGTEYKLLEKQECKSVKAILYGYRVLLTGIHLMRSGAIEADIVRLADEYRLPFIADLIVMKKAEKITSYDLNWPFHAAEYAKLERRMEQAFHDSQLPEDRDRQAVHDWLVELRMREIQSPLSAT